MIKITYFYVISPEGFAGDIEICETVFSSVRQSIGLVSASLYLYVTCKLSFQIFMILILHDYRIIFAMSLTCLMSLKISADELFLKRMWSLERFIIQKIAFLAFSFVQFLADVQEIYIKGLSKQYVFDNLETNANRLLQIFMKIISQEYISNNFDILENQCR